MFGKNERAGAIKGDDLLVTAIYHTLLGEGPWSGLPAVFVRLAKCNLSCSFCDTWFDTGERMSIVDVAHTTSDLVAGTNITENQHVLVITGGEPTLQEALPSYIEFAAKTQRWANIQIETNGLRSTLFEKIQEAVTWVVSPKCHERNGKPEYYRMPAAKALDYADCLRFVMTAERPYSRVPRWAIDWRNATGQEIFVSPMNIYLPEPAAALRNRLAGQSENVYFRDDGLHDVQANRRNHEYAAEYCLRHGLRFQAPVHRYSGVA